MKTILASTLIIIGFNAIGQTQSEQVQNQPKKITKVTTTPQRGLVYGAEMKTKKFKKPTSVKLISNEPKGTLETNNQ